MNGRGQQVLSMDRKYWAWSWKVWAWRGSNGRGQEGYHRVLWQGCYGRDVIRGVIWDGIMGGNYVKGVMGRDNGRGALGGDYGKGIMRIVCYGPGLCEEHYGGDDYTCTCKNSGAIWIILLWEGIMGWLLWEGIMGLL